MSEYSDVEWETPMAGEVPQSLEAEGESREQEVSEPEPTKEEPTPAQRTAQNQKKKSRPNERPQQVVIDRDVFDIMMSTIKNVLPALADKLKDTPSTVANPTNKYGNPQYFMVNCPRYFFSGGMKLFTKKNDVLTFYPDARLVSFQGKEYKEIDVFLNTLNIQSSSKFRNSGREPILLKVTEEEANKAMMPDLDSMMESSAPEPVIDPSKPLTAGDLMELLGGDDRPITRSELAARIAGLGAGREVAKNGNNLYERLPHPDDHEARREIISRMDGTRMDRRQDLDPPEVVGNMPMMPRQSARTVATIPGPAADEAAALAKRKK